MKTPLEKPKKIIITKPPKKNGPIGKDLFKQAFLAIIIFFVLVSLYSMISGVDKPEETSLSNLAQ